MNFNGFPGRGGGGLYNFAAQNQQRMLNNMQNSFSRPVIRPNHANKNSNIGVTSRLGPAPITLTKDTRVANNSAPKPLMTKGVAQPASKPTPTPSKPTPITFTTPKPNHISAPKPAPISAPKPTPISAPKPAAKPAPISAPKPAPISAPKAAPAVAAKQNNATATPNRGAGLLASPNSKAEQQGTMNVLSRFKKENADVPVPNGQRNQNQSGGYPNNQNAGNNQNQINSNFNKSNGPAQNQNAQNRPVGSNGPAQNQNAQNRPVGSNRQGGISNNQTSSSNNQNQRDASSGYQNRKTESEGNQNEKAGGMAVRLGPKNDTTQQTNKPGQQRKSGNYNNDDKSYQNKKRGNNQHGDGGRDMRRDNRGRGPYNQDNFWTRLQELKGEQYDLEPLELKEQKFNAQSRLFCGSLPRDMTVEKIEEMFSKFGELGQVYHNKDGAFAFINYDFRANAEKAIKELAGTQMRGRNLMIRFAAITTGIQVKNLSPAVTNELLYKSFGIFGNVEMCRVNVDDRGKSIGSGLIIFTEKRSAVMAFKRCQEESFFITSTLRPVIVEPWETRDDDEGFSEANIIKNETYRKERKVGPRFAEPNSYESEYGKRWKQLFDIYKEKKQALENDLKAEMEALEVKMQLVVHQHETEKLRKELALREEEALQLQMGLGAYGVEPARPTMEKSFAKSRLLNNEPLLSSGRGEYDGAYVGNTAGVKRPYNYYDEPRPLETQAKRQQTQSQYDSYQRGGQSAYGDQRTYEDRSYANVVSGRSGTAYDQGEAAPAGYADEKDETAAAQPASLIETVDAGLVPNPYEASATDDSYSNYKQRNQDYEPFAAPNKRGRVY